MPPDRAVFPVGLLGLPLNLNDNIVCALVIVLAGMLQMRFQNTFLGEGWLALLGFIGYVAIRFWLLNRRHPRPGELVIEGERIFFPASVNLGKAEVVNFTDCNKVIAWFFKTKGGGQNLTSIEFINDRQSYSVSWLAVDLNLLERSLIKHGVRVIRSAGTYERMLAPALLVFMLVLLLFLIRVLLN